MTVDMGLGYGRAGMVVRVEMVGKVGMVGGLRVEG